MRLSIVVPCYDERGSLERLHAAVESSLSGVVEDWELLLVDDGSSDGSLALMRELSARDARVRYVAFSRNFGKEAALLAGLRRTTGDAVVLMDADLQHPPELIPQLVAMFHEGHDQVVARRTRQHDGRVRAVGTRLYYRLMNSLMDVPLMDGAGDFRLLSRTAVDALLALPERNRFSKGLYSWIGFEPAVVDYADVARGEGASKWSLRALLNYGIDGLLSFNDRPIRLSIYTGLVLTSLSIVYITWLVFNYLARGVDTPGYLTLVSAVLVFGGIQLMCIGLLGEYVGRIYYEVKRRPHYVVREADAPQQPGAGPAAGEGEGGARSCACACHETTAAER